MRESLLSRYLITATERINLVTRHLRGEVNSNEAENSSVGKELPNKNSLNTELLTILLKGIEAEISVLKHELETRK